MINKSKTKPIFIKMKLFGKCWFYPCENQAIGTLNYSDGSEVKVCWSCARKRAKIRRIRKDKGLSRVNERQLILEKPLDDNKSQKTILEGNL